MTILQSLNRYYDRMAERGEVVEPGYSVEPIALEIVLAANGTIVAANEKRDATGKKPKPEIVPKWFSRQGNGSTPFFLWDNTAYALGVTKKDPKKTLRDHEAFRNLHLKELASEVDVGLLALRLFVVKWHADQFPQSSFNDKMVDRNVAFRLDGDVDEYGHPRFIHDRPSARAHIERLRTNTSSESPVICLVTGKLLPPVRLHPKIKGLGGDQAEISLVSFNNEAFESYGHKQGDNAPTSEEAAFRYGAALNRLLDRAASRNRIRIADATVVFWADIAGVGEAAAEAAETFFFNLIEPPDDASEAAKLGDLLKQVAQGRPAEHAEPNLAPGTRFHVLGLAPNAARLSVRYWLEDDFSEFARRLAAHYTDLAIEPVPWRAKLPSIQRLLVKTTALQEKLDNIPPLLAGEMTRAILTGTRYPHTLLAAALARLRAGDDPCSGWHAAAIKAVLARDRRLNSSKEGVPMSLDRENPSSAYQLGRLFAAVETAQRLALPGINTTIRDRYFGAASAGPASIFPLLMRGVQNHLGKLRKDHKGGWLEREIEEISNHLPPQLPRSLALEAQGRFVLGYYHQRRGQFADKQAQTEIAEIETGETDNDDE